MWPDLVIIPHADLLPDAALQLRQVQILGLRVAALLRLWNNLELRAHGVVPLRRVVGKLHVVPFTGWRFCFRLKRLPLVPLQPAEDIQVQHRPELHGQVRTVLLLLHVQGPEGEQQPARVRQGRQREGDVNQEVGEGQLAGAGPGHGRCEHWPRHQQHTRQHLLPPRHGEIQGGNGHGCRHHDRRDTKRRPWGAILDAAVADAVVSDCAQHLMRPAGQCRAREGVKGLVLRRRAARQVDVAPPLDRNPL
mmetsp:Transcript_107318/g.256264  ORF Transcript_107318/g.256264 Transcript_107318/m.256264 type:complete len:249 (-) Transcript_107318:799-1545(-)